jgi:hypothetical protein
MSRENEMPHGQHSRPLAALIALWLLALAGLLLRVLIANWSDDAYLGMALVGTALLVASGLFLLAALLPGTTPVRVASLGGLVVIGVVCVMSGLSARALVAALATHNVDQPGSAVLWRQIVGLAVVLPSLAGILVLLRRQRRSRGA